MPAGGMERHVVPAESDGCEERPADAGRDRPSGPPRLHGGQDDTAERGREADLCGRTRPLARREAHRDGHHGGRARDRRDDADRARRHPAIERDQPRRPRDRRGHGEQD